MLTIRNFIFLLGGFTQHAGNDTGMMRLWASLFEWRDARRGTRMMIMPREWNDDVASMAALVERHGPHQQDDDDDNNDGNDRAQAQGRAVIIVVGYSYGGGWTAPRLARRLARQGCAVDLMILIDPVWRARLLPLKLLSLTGRIEVTIPANVRNVVTWRQRGGGRFEPRGSRLELEDASRTRVLADVELTAGNIDHTAIQYEPSILAESFTRIISLMEDPA